MDFKNLKVNRNTVIVGAVVIGLALIVSLVPTALTSLLATLSVVSAIAFYLSATIWIWRHMK
jgi:hypothetical protein